MNRPEYSNEATYKAERDVIRKLNKRQNRLKYIQLPRKNAMSCNIFDGAAQCAVAKIVCRNNKVGKFPTYKFSLQRIETGRKIATENGMRFILYVQWEDAFAHIDLTGKLQFEIDMGGRKDRGDAEDIEEMVEIPYSSMTFTEGSAPPKREYQPSKPRIIYKESPQLGLF